MSLYHNPILITVTEGCQETAFYTKKSQVEYMLDGRDTCTVATKASVFTSMAR